MASAVIFSSVPMTEAQVPQTNSPFAVQMPQNQPAQQQQQQQQALPQGVMPGGVYPGSTGALMPMALPPTGGMPPVPQQETILNPYNRPSFRPTPAPVTKSEIVPYNPGSEWEPTVVVKTSEGEFKIQLSPIVAPTNVKNFLDLALGQKEFIDTRTGKKVRRPFYTGLNCHRVLKGYYIQCGCPFGNGRGGPGFKVNDELSPAVRFDRPGIVAMAPMREGGGKGPGYEKNSNGSQFFISLAPLPESDGKFTIIGKISSGMETIKKIASTPTGPTDRPIKRVIIFSIDPDLPPASKDNRSVSDPMTADPSKPPEGTQPPAYDPFAMPPPANP